MKTEFCIFFFPFLLQKYSEKMRYLTGIRSYVSKALTYQNIPVLATGAYAILLLILLAFQSVHITQLEKRTIGSKNESENSNYKRAVERTAHSLYTHWGRKSCSAKFSSTIYSGVAAGSLYSDTGGGSNILCLPMDPQWSNFTGDVETGSHIYGSEYEVSDYKNNPKFGLFLETNARTLHDHNIPCAVCQTNGPAAVMMLPGRNECYTGWYLEYSGYLMTSHWKHNGRTSYLCIDKEPEADRCGYRDENGALFYHVQAQCGSLPCPPYRNNEELTCSVCSNYGISERGELS
ncbi:uncharacterized protein LOC115232406 [Octopus sinensis]|uniref:Uncharacterized protein LOC115232406 n=1 Tax=Octopus sinensis TaxID=2607531 RepID=A0A6P7U9T3_9MOLL|nr:uncharacterized protein LOC115232406 [Octopus sinensis]